MFTICVYVCVRLWTVHTLPLRLSQTMSVGYIGPLAPAASRVTGMDSSPLPLLSISAPCSIQTRKQTETTVRKQKYCWPEASKGKPKAQAHKTFQWTLDMMGIFLVYVFSLVSGQYSTQACTHYSSTSYHWTIIGLAFILYYCYIKFFFFLLVHLCIVTWNLL